MCCDEDDLLDLRMAIGTIPSMYLTDEGDESSFDPAVVEAAIDNELV